MKPVLAILFTVITLSACSRDNPMDNLPDLKDVRANLAFTCTHEADHLPPLDPEADQLFQYGRYLQKRDGATDYDEVARYYRIAAAHGHYKANHNAQLLVSQGQAKSPYPLREAIDWATQLVEAGIPSGYYDIGHYLKLGYGFKQNDEMARRYIRKAADLGNADAQYYVGDLLTPASMAPEIGWPMYRCAAEQGHGTAARELGVHLRGRKQYQEAVEAFQMSVKAGDGTSAMILEKAFAAPPPTEVLYHLGLTNDPERVRRYGLIGDMFDRNGLHVTKVPDIDQIVPLPPAKLPAWDGTFQWEKDHARILPKPSEELVNRLAKAKNLDPATGLKIPPPPKAALGTCANTGERCPESGLWRAYNLEHGFKYPGDSLWQFSKGDVMPRYAFFQSRAFALLDWWLGEKLIKVAVQWRLVGYGEDA